MSARIVMLIFIVVTILYGDTNTTSEVSMPETHENDDNGTLSKTERSADDLTTTSTADANRPARDLNSSDSIASTTKLDDVSTVDIVKEQRKQRKIERQEAIEEPSKPRQLVDTIVVKGSVLQGQIDQLTSEHISFRLIYGEGSIRIKYSDVESLMTEHEYNIFFDGKETQGYITGIQDHAFLKVRHGEIEELITIAKIDRLVISENEDDSFENKMRNTFPYLSGNVDIGLEYESGTNIKNKVKVGGHLERQRSAVRTLFDITYEYEVTKTFETEEVLNKQELYSFLVQDYALSEADLLFAQIGYDFDVPRGVDNRVYPSLGYGYRIQEDKTRWVQFKVGGGYVYETFIDYASNEYIAGYLGATAEYELRDLRVLNRVLFGANFFYMPGIQDPSANWLLRYSVTASIPLLKALSLKTVARQVSDDNPSPDVGNNKLTFDLYISLRF